MKEASPKTPDTKAIRLTAREYQVALKNLEIVLQSLHRVGSFYADDKATCDQETIKALDDFKCVQRLSMVRTQLWEAVRRELGHEDVEALEEMMGQVRHWAPKKEPS